MSERIVVKKADGSCIVLVPSEACIAELLKKKTSEKGKFLYANRAAAVEAIAVKDAPRGLPYRVVGVSDLPEDRLFRSAWRDDGSAVKTDLSIAKEIAHGKRRLKRDEDFAPHDEIISKQIPGKDPAAAEAARQDIRDEDAVTQASIDAATSEAALRSEMQAGGL